MADITQKIKGSANNQAGGDINETHNYNFQRRISRMEGLIADYHEEQKNGDPSFKGFIEKIKHLSSPKTGNGEFKCLEKKLEEGGYESDSEHALELKEDYTKKLMMGQLSNASQNIHAYLLCQVLSYFKNHVVHALKGDHTKENVKSLITQYVINPVNEELGENVLDLYHIDIYAMIYFLTGNCHIKWN